MLPSAHFFSGVAIFAVLSILNLIPMDFSYFTLVIIFSMVPDVDTLLSVLHRNLVTHTPIFLGSVALVVVLFAINGLGLVVACAFFTHLLLDSVDYGLMILYPFRRKKYGLSLLRKTETQESKSQIAFLKDYLANWSMLYLELAVMSTALILLVISMLKLD